MPDAVRSDHSFVPQGEVSLPRLCAMLDAAAMEYECKQEDGESNLYVRRGVDFPLWIHIDAEFRYLQLHTYVNIDARVSGQFEAVNAVNESAALLQFHLDGTRLYGYYWMTFAYGMDSRQFIFMLREFGAAFRAGADCLVAKIESEGHYRN